MSQKIPANDIRVGNVLEFQKKLWSVLKREHVKPGKGGAFIQVEMKNFDGTKINHRFRSDETVLKAFIEDEEYEFTFCDEKNVSLMNVSDFSQIVVNRSIFGDKIGFLVPDAKVTIQRYDGQILGIKLQDKVTLSVKETESYIKGQTATASYKPAILETGLKVMVPQFVKPGDRILVNTEDGSYFERAE